MIEAIGHRPKPLLALGGAIMAICLMFLLGLPSPANAEVGSYCGNQTLGGGGTCYGSQRLLYQTYGWGDQHSVCVWASYGGPIETPLGGSSYKACSSGPGAGVYSPAYWENLLLYPGIKNNAAGNNTVHGNTFSH
jgi:hypothetical protein